MNVSRAIRWAKWGVAAGLVAIVAAAGARLALLDGWLRTVRIDGASMAPTLCGAHLNVTCTDCGFSFRCDAEHLPESGTIVCPNCGFRGLEADAFPSQRGDTVLVDRWPLVGAGPRRWDVVTLDEPLAGGQAVKRVAGLPGERLAIRGGDLYADGKIVRKSLADLNRAAILVHDNDHLPKSCRRSSAEPFLRWRPAAAGRDWTSIDGGFRYQPADDPSPHAPGWLEYVHWRCDASLTPRDKPATIFDNDPYNQAQARRLNVVTDLVLTCDAEIAEGGRLMLAAIVRGRRLEVEIDAVTGAIVARQGGDEIVNTLAPIDLIGRQVQVEFGYCDAQLLLALDRRLILAEPVAGGLRPEAAGTALPSQLHVGGAGGQLSITHLRVWRDIYLLEPNGTERDWEMDEALGDEQYLLLGDNPPVSIDGRHWQGAGLARSQMRGVVVVPLGGARH